MEYLVVGLIFIVALLLLHLSFSRDEIWLLKQSIEQERKDAVKRSKSVTRGNIVQEFIPLFPDFPYDMSDCKFSGQPIDFMVFENMTALRDGVDVQINIVLADVKVNKAQRTKVQNAIKNAVENNRVRWETWTVDQNKQLKIK